MCMIKNEFAEELLKDLRKFDRKEIADVKEKSAILARIKMIQESLEEYESILKLQLSKELKETVYISDLEKKIYLSEGKSSTVFDNAKVFDILGKETYLEISSVQKTKLDALGDISKKVIAEASETKAGNPYITCAKMNKKELIESKK